MACLRCSRPTVFLAAAPSYFQLFPDPSPGALFVAESLPYLVAGGCRPGDRSLYGDSNPPAAGVARRGPLELFR